MIETSANNIFDFNTAAVAKAQIDPAAQAARLERLRARLKQDAHCLVADIFPRARIHGGEARIGSLDGEPGESLSIQITGDKAGLWHDHATGEGGDLIDLWQQTARTEFPKAVEDLEHFLGITQTAKPAWTNPVRKLAEARQQEAKANPAEPVDRTLGAPVATWHYYDEAGRIHSAQVRYELANGEKDYRPKCFRDGVWRTGAPAERILYRLPQIGAADTVVLVEGEKAADALANLGIEATTAMGGANAPIDKTDWTPLKGKTVLLWPDNDAPGFAHMERVEAELQRLGVAVTTIKIPPGKPEKWDAADAISEEADVLSILGSAEAPETPAKPSLRFKILSIDQLFDFRPPSWRIDGIFPTHGSSAVYGAYESFKTFVGIDMALHLATGHEWCGRKVDPCPVLYVAGEGQHGIGQRIFGWVIAKNDGVRPANFWTLPEAVALPNGADLDELLRAIDALPQPPGLIVLDTITRMSGGGSLNDEKDVQAYIRGSDRLRLHTGGHVMHIGHSGKDREKGLMGSVVLPAAMETIIAVERAGDALTLVNTNPKGKQKDGPNFEDIHLVTRSIPFDRQGEAYKTLIVEQGETPRPDSARSSKAYSDVDKPARLGPLQHAIMKALQQAAQQGQGLGLMRLSRMVGKDDGNVATSLGKLLEAGLVFKNDEDGRITWTLPED